MHTENEEKKILRELHAHLGNALFTSSFQNEKGDLLVAYKYAKKVDDGYQLTERGVALARAAVAKLGIASIFGGAWHY